jgi:hypothetical protein
MYLDCPHSLHTNTSHVVCPSIALILVDILDVSQPILIKFSKHIQYNSNKPYFCSILNENYFQRVEQSPIEIQGKKAMLCPQRCKLSKYVFMILTFSL